MKATIAYIAIEVFMWLLSLALVILLIVLLTGQAHAVEGEWEVKAVAPSGAWSIITYNDEEYEDTAKKEVIKSCEKQSGEKCGLVYTIWRLAE